MTVVRDAGLASFMQPDWAAPLAAEPIPLHANEDLPWIMDRLADRLFADGAFLALHVDDGRSPVIIATVGTAAAQDQDIDALAELSAECSEFANLGPESAHIWHDHGPRGKFLCLPVARNEQIRLVVGVVYDYRTVFEKMAIELVLKRLHPVLTGYLKLWLMARTLENRLNAVRSTLDMVEIGVFLLNARADIIFQNAAGTRILDEGDALRRSRKTLAAVNLSAAVKLRVALDHVMTANTSRSSAVLHVPRRSGGQPLLVTIVGIEAVPEVETDPAAVAFVHDPNVDIAPFLKPVCELHCLSPAESRLAAHLASGHTVAASALRMRISEATGRTYLKQIFVKTGTNRQSELVRKLILGAGQVGIPELSSVI